MLYLKTPSGGYQDFDLAEYSRQDRSRLIGVVIDNLIRERDRGLTGDYKAGIQYAVELLKDLRTMA